MLYTAYAKRGGSGEPHTRNDTFSSGESLVMTAKSIPATALFCTTLWVKQFVLRPFGTDGVTLFNLFCVHLAQMV